LTSNWGILAILSESRGYQLGKKGQGVIGIVVIVVVVVVIVVIVVIVIVIVIVVIVIVVVPALVVVIIPALVVVVVVVTGVLALVLVSPVFVLGGCVVLLVLTCFDSLEFAIEEDIVTTLNLCRIDIGRDGDRICERGENDQNSGESLGEPHGCCVST